MYNLKLIINIYYYYYYYYYYYIQMRKFIYSDLKQALSSNTTSYKLMYK